MSYTSYDQSYVFPSLTAARVFRRTVDSAVVTAVMCEETEIGDGQWKVAVNNIRTRTDNRWINGIALGICKYHRELVGQGVGLR